MRLLSLVFALAMAGPNEGPEGDDVPHVLGPPAVGAAFPDLVFPVLGEDGNDSLSSFRGTKVLLIQFASW